MREHEAELSALRRSQLRLVFWVCVLSSVSSLALWYFDHQQGMVTRWDAIGTPIMSAVYALAAAGLHWRPSRLNLIMTSALLVTSIYYLGTFYVAANDQSSTGLYSMASNSQYMPLYYVGAFIALQRGAALICWVHYAGLVGLYLYQYGLQATEANLHAHLWTAVLSAHPGYIVALHYITALKGRLQAAEFETQRSKERFLAMLSHEIRTPLQAVLGSIDLLALKAHSPPEQRAVHRIRHAAAQLDTHLRDVTEYTRMDNPSWQLQTAEVNLPALVREVCEGYQAQAAAKGLQLACEIAPADDAALQHVQSDAQRLRQVLVNLISNALKYTPQGSVSVSLSLSGGAEGGAHPNTAPQLCLAVSDTGIGIPPPERERIFEPYVRLEDRRTAGQEGSGLGLAVVRRLVDRLGGQLQLDTELNQGSCFRVTLPLQAPQ
jgi:signal transduction histidine kinase